VTYRRGGPEAQSDLDFVRAAYRLLLMREPDDEGLNHHAERLADELATRSGIIRDLVTSAEFERLASIDEAVQLGLRAAREQRLLSDLRAPPRTDERLIELPWVLSRYRGESCVLDLGYAFAERAYLAALAHLGPQTLVGLDLAAGDPAGFLRVRGDIRGLPFPNGTFELVNCVSTVEHVGLDNSRYGQIRESDFGGMLTGLSEIRRVLAPTGRLLLTLPCGAPEHHGWFAQRDVQGWVDLTRQSGFDTLELEVFALESNGWRLLPANRTWRKLNNLSYGKRGPGASAVLCLSLTPTFR